MRKLKIIKIIYAVVAVIMFALLAIPAYAQMPEPDVVFGVQQVECYRHCLEANDDQLYLILGRIEYTVPPPPTMSPNPTSSA